ncbi:hypothetical protein QEH54_05630 [Pelagicoccus sp. SDUM812003]|nr:hypothetical protein [Pelagicoccus sp. SDUM812003]
MDTSHYGRQLFRYDSETARKHYRDRRDEARHSSRERYDRARRHFSHHHDHNSKKSFHHRHGHGCGHHYFDGRWHDFPRTHRHHAHCGHSLVNGIWISFTLGHIHGPGCGHFQDGGIWLSYSGSRHRHHIGCGHYFYDGYWHNRPRYHHHHEHCGHYFYDGRWNDFPQRHYHSETCGHVYDGSSWLVVNGDGHVHGNDCGHYYVSGRWFTYPRSYYRIGQSDSLFFFIDLGDYRNRHFPDWAYDEFLAGGSPVDIFYSKTPISQAYVSFAQNRYYDSIMHFKRAIIADPDNGLLYLARAQAYIAIGDYREAFDDLKKGMEIIPGWVDLRLSLSEIYSDSDSFARHANELEEWVERYPRDFKAHFVLGYVYFFNQNYEEAKNELLYALSWDDELEPAHAMMDNILRYEAEAEAYTYEESTDPNEEADTTQE